MISRRRVCVWLMLACASALGAQPVHHYVFFGQNPDRIRTDSAFLRSKTLEGAQVAYSWRQLEPAKDRYDFGGIRSDLAFLRAHGKRLWVQLQDVSFSPTRINVPLYLVEEPQFNGGADRQYDWDGEDQQPRVEGWMARRWDPAVQARLYRLFDALGRDFDGRIEGINLAETSFGVGTTGKLFPKGFSFDIYREAIIANMKALKRAFPHSVAMVYANFMPGEWRPDEDKGYLRAVYDAAKQSSVGVGGPDLLPFRPGQLGSSYPLIREASDVVPTGVAVQDGNIGDADRRTGKRMSIAELIDFATTYLKVDYIFWGTEEPYYSAEVVPLISRAGPRPH